MRHRLLFGLLAALALASALPGDADARAAGGSSFGSRGSRSFSMPPSTRTAPSYAAPLQRSVTPQPAPSYGQAAPAYGAAGAGAGGYGRSPFSSGLMGGLIGAGIGGMLFGGGFFHGLGGGASFLGLLLQLFILVMLGRFLWRLFVSRQPAVASGNMFARGPAASPAPQRMAAAGGSAATPLQVTPGDFQAFEQLLHGIQAAWSAHHLATLRNIASPEMTSYFGEQLSEQTSRGVRNTVSDVRLEQGDLSEAWAEPGREYATVAMRFSMLDVTRDGGGHVVDGSPDERVTATELWTFLRAPGGRWILSAIQQAR